MRVVFSDGYFPTLYVLNFLFILYLGVCIVKKSCKLANFSDYLYCVTVDFIFLKYISLRWPLAMEPKLTLAQDFLGLALQRLGLHVELLYQHFQNINNIILIQEKCLCIYFWKHKVYNFFIVTTQSPNYLVSLFSLLSPQAGTHM